LALFVVALFNIGPQVILLDMGIDVGHIESDHFAQTGDVGAQVLDGGHQQSLQHGLLQGTLLFREPASGGHGALHIKAVREVAMEHRPQADLEHEQGILDEEAAQSRTVGVALTELDEQGFEVGGWWMWALAGTSGVKRTLWNHAPIEEGKELTLALDDGIMLEHECQGVLVKRLGFWYDRHGKLLAG